MSTVAIGYLRVSTREQGRSGLGLAAQRHDIEGFGELEGYDIRSWYQDVQTGAGADALLLRPGLATALKEARAARCPVIVSRLDRLSRNVHFITGLMEHRVHFVVAALGRDCDDFTLHMCACFAEHERNVICERTRVALAAAKRRGRKFGLSLFSKARRRHFIALGHAALRKAAIERAEAYRLHIEWALRQPGVNGKLISFRAAANKLTERNIESPMGGRWSGRQLQSMAFRLGLHHPPGCRRRKTTLPQVYAVWKQHPEFIAKQVIASLGPQNPLGFSSALLHLKACRMGAAKGSRMYSQARWPLDRWTTARIQVSAICKRHPEFTATEVLGMLGARYPVRVRWVRRIMKDCRRLSIRRTSKEWAKGRGPYDPRRPGRRRT